MEILQTLTPTVKSSRHGKHKNPNYQREYYCQNREKLLAYGRTYYGVKKLLKNCLKPENKGTKIGVKKLFSSHTHYNNITPNKIKNFFFGKRGARKKN